MSTTTSETASTITIIKWFDAPQKHDYPAAQSYLSLTMKPDLVKKIVAALKKAQMTTFKSKDIFRAPCYLYSEIQQFSRRESPPLKSLQAKRFHRFFSTERKPTGRLIIADGYHRLCAVYGFDEDAVDPVQDSLIVRSPQQLRDAKGGCRPSWSLPTNGAAFFRNVGERFSSSSSPPAPESSLLRAAGEINAKSAKVSRGRAGP